MKNKIVEDLEAEPELEKVPRRATTTACSSNAVNYLIQTDRLNDMA